MKKYLVYLTIGLFVSACDVDSAMLFGGPDQGYEFNNADLVERDEAEFSIDESLVDVFTLESENAGDIAEIYAVYVGNIANIKTDTVILYCHGNGPNMDVFWPIVAQLSNLGEQHRFGVLMYDYRGYGKSSGTSTGLGTMEADLVAALNWLKENGLTDDRLVIFGNSLGTIPAGEWVAETQFMNPAKLILEVPQSNADAIGQDASGLSLPSTMLTDFNFDIVEGVANYQGPLLWMHGTEDAVAPIDNARKMFEAHNGVYKDSVIIDGAGHGLRWDMGKKAWGDAIFNFIIKD